MDFKQLKPFPKTFLWGASSSAYQCEGAYMEDGRTLCVSDTKPCPEGTTNFNDGVDHYHRFREYIALMAGVDAVVLTAGVGEHSIHMRRMIFAGLEPLGLIIDHKKNRESGYEHEISDERSRVKMIIIPTNEELMIAHDVYGIVSGRNDEESAKLR